MADFASQRFFFCFFLSHAHKKRSPHQGGTNDKQDEEEAAAAMAANQSIKELMAAETKASKIISEARQGAPLRVFRAPPRLPTLTGTS